MSVYSGFSTRHQETHYSKLLGNLIFLLSNRSLSAMKGEFFDDVAFAIHVGKLYRRMNQLELQKYLPPKATQYFKNLAAHCTNYQDYSSLYYDPFEQKPAEFPDVHHKLRDRMDPPKTGMRSSRNKRLVPASYYQEIFKPQNRRTPARGNKRIFKNSLDFENHFNDDERIFKM